MMWERIKQYYTLAALVGMILSFIIWGASYAEQWKTHFKNDAKQIYLLRAICRKLPGPNGECNFQEDMQ